MNEPTPRYDQLPELGDLGVRHSWGVISREVGTLSFIGPEQVAAAAGLVREGRTIPLNLPLDAFDPPLFGRAPVRHAVVEATRIDAEDVIDSFNPQASSQLDGLAHVRAREHGYYGGVTDLGEARRRVGMQHVAHRGIAGRGILLDLVELDRGDGVTAFDGRMYDVEMLETALRHQNLDVRRGDVLLVRTGWAEQYLAADDADPRPTAWNGLRADERMAAWLWDRGVALVGSDNPAVESAPGSREIGSLHRRLLPALGMALLELLDLRALRDACASSGRWEFLFVSVPLHLEGTVSSPANAMALL